MAVALLGCVTFALVSHESTAKAVDKPAVLSASPSLYPAFDWNQRDYVVRCQATRRIPRVNLNLPANWTARVAGSPARGGKFRAGTNRGPGAGTTVQIRRPGAGAASFRIRCLPKDFARFEFRRYRAGGPRLTFAQVGGNYAVFFDRAGTPVWWMKNGIPPLHPQVLRDGTLSWLVEDGGKRGRTAGTNGRFAWGIRSLSGNLIRKVRGANRVLTDAHELMLLPNGNYLINTFPRDRGLDLRPFGGPAKAVGRGSLVQELTPRGRLVWKWRARAHIELAETGRWWKMILKRRQPLDYLHFNSAEPVGGSMVMSFRHLDAVYKINRSTGEIIWKLGGTPTDESLEVLNDPLGEYPFGGQHDARVDKNGILSVFDNGSFLKRAPRVVSYRINQGAGTATLVSSFRDRQVPISTCCGSAEKLPNGQWLVNWGGLGNIRKPGIKNLVGAYSPEGRPIFRLWTYGKHMYRAQPVAGPFPSLVRLRQAMDNRYVR
ncbi:MAG: aryl-sulfate sulfotransferase [Solirubrobacterales bacterium]|nr:aryl-sulfate sulfotransferase [Solirubrobacterales bacterium]